MNDDCRDGDAGGLMLIATTGLGKQPPRPAMTTAELQKAQRLVRQIPVGDSVVDAILALVRSGRPEDTAEGPRRFVAWGPGPRASQALMLACRPPALPDGPQAPPIRGVPAMGRPGPA